MEQFNKVLRICHPGKKYQNFLPNNFPTVSHVQRQDGAYISPSSVPILTKWGVSQALLLSSLSQIHAAVDLQCLGPPFHSLN